MNTLGYQFHKHCRWCGTLYYAKKPSDRDGFDKSKCKQAHYRAYKKWVTATSAGPAPDAGSRLRKR